MPIPSSDVVSILLTHGAKVNDRGGTHCRGVTPLHDAAVNGHLGVVQLLYNHGASLSIKDDDVSDFQYLLVSFTSSFCSVVSSALCRV